MHNHKSNAKHAETRSAYFFPKAKSLYLHRYRVCHKHKNIPKVSENLHFEFSHFAMHNQEMQLKSRTWVHNCILSHMQ